MGKPPTGKMGDEGAEGHDAATSADLKEMARNIEHARIAAGMSQTDLAQLCGISQSHISQIELGSWGPKMHTLVLLARALRVGVNELLPAHRRREGS